MVCLTTFHFPAGTQPKVAVTRGAAQSVNPTSASRAGGTTRSSAHAAAKVLVEPPTTLALRVAERRMVAQ